MRGLWARLRDQARSEIAARSYELWHDDLIHVPQSTHLSHQNELDRLCEFVRRSFSYDVARECLIHWRRRPHAPLRAQGNWERLLRRLRRIQQLRYVWSNQ